MPTTIPADACKALAEHLRGGANPQPDDVKAAQAVCDYACTVMEDPHFPKRSAPLAMMSREGLALEMESRAKDGSGFHEWDEVCHAILAHVPGTKKVEAKKEAKPVTPVPHAPPAKK